MVSDLPPRSLNEEEKQTRRSKLFRHHVRLDSTKLTNKSSSPPLLSPTPSLYNFSTPPTTLLERGEKTRVGRTTTLPLDYRSTVATLPNITAKEKCPKTFDLTELAVESALPKFESDNEPTNYYVKETY